MKIITISREFGSGGRELGKRLADILGCDYYDREIITAIAENKQLDESFVENVMDAPPVWQTVPLNFGHSFAGIPSATNWQTSLLLEQKRILESIADRDRDCVIVGRNADVILASYKPFSIFVCASMQSKVERCIARTTDSEKLTYRQIEKNIHRIDKARAHTREIVSCSKWGERSEYNLIVNTTGWNIKELTPAVATLINNWYDSQSNK